MLAGRGMLVKLKHWFVLESNHRILWGLEERGLLGVLVGGGAGLLAKVGGTDLLS